MTEETKALLREGIVPVVLDNHREGHRLAARLYRTFGLPSLVCGARRSFWDLLDPFSAFRPLSLGEKNSRLLSEQLTDLAAEYEDCFLLLIPLHREDRDTIRESGELLESRFVCRAPEELWNDPMLDGIRVT